MNIIDSLKYYLSCHHHSMGITQIQRYVLPLLENIRTNIIPYGFVCTFHIEGFRTFLLQTHVQSWYVDMFGKNVNVVNLPTCLLPESEHIHVFEIIVTNTDIIWVLDTLVYNNNDLTNCSIHLRYKYIQDILAQSQNDTTITENRDLSNIPLFSGLRIFRTTNLQFRPLYQLVYEKDVLCAFNCGICFYALFLPFQFIPSSKNGPFFWKHTYTVRMIWKPSSDSDSIVQHLFHPFNISSKNDHMLLFATKSTETKEHDVFVPICSAGSYKNTIIPDSKYVEVCWHQENQCWNIVNSSLVTNTLQLCDTIEYIQYVCEAIQNH
jgi:hypothetical protein